jgi:hypothetical protein
MEGMSRGAHPNMGLSLSIKGIAMPLGPSKWCGEKKVLVRMILNRMMAKETKIYLLSLFLSNSLGTR